MDDLTLSHLHVANDKLRGNNIPNGQVCKGGIDMGCEVEATIPTPSAGGVIDNALDFDKLRDGWSAIDVWNEFEIHLWHYTAGLRALLVNQLKQKSTTLCKTLCLSE